MAQASNSSQFHQKTEFWLIPQVSSLPKLVSRSVTAWQRMVVDIESSIRIEYSFVAAASGPNPSRKTFRRRDFSFSSGPVARLVVAAHLHLERH
jgi:hypothetical protein